MDLCDVVAPRGRWAVSLWCGGGVVLLIGLMDGVCRWVWVEYWSGYAW